MDADFPAAHSMDTAYFAVDRDGHVAVFDTGEMGVVPEEAPHTEGGMFALPVEEIAACVTPTTAVFDLHGRVLPGPLGELHESMREGARFPQDRMLLFLKSTELVTREFTKERALWVLGTTGQAVYFSRLQQQLARKIHKAKHCLGCIQLGHNSGSRPTGHELTRLGIFFFEPVEYSCFGAHSPYGRFEMPAQPLHVDQLPPNLRRDLKRFQLLSLCFAETPHVQPAEHTARCIAWGGCAYLAADGIHVRAMPGYEDTYRREYQSLVHNIGQDPRGRLMRVEEPPL